ncbi:MAG: lamin tail domain-containing protein [Pirellulales bacterium]|nr:lamin tail domain-containing protein [Pirellulales bacterium]
MALAALSALPAAPARAALVISEVLANEVGSAGTGEWIEIFNTGPAAIDLTNYKIGDEESNTGTGAGEAMHLFPSGASIAPGAVQVVAVSADRFFEVYGFLPAYEINPTDAAVPDLSPYAAWDADGGVMNMSNTNDQALILDPADNIVDRVSWGNTFAFNPAIDLTIATQDGQSFERKNVYVDADAAADWQFGPAAATAAGRSTPGVARVPEPTSIMLAAAVAGLCSLSRRSRGCWRAAARRPQ